MYYEIHVAHSIAVAGTLINAGATVIHKLSHVESNHLEFTGPHTHLLKGRTGVGLSVLAP